jgi:hypothetical protein
MTAPVLATITIALAASAITASAQQPPHVRPLGPIVRVSMEPLGSVSAVIELPGRRVLVNDIVAHRVMLFDSTLATSTVVADSTSATSNAYGARPGGLIPYHGDSALFVDQSSLSMLVITPTGRIARVISVPRAADAPYLVGGPWGTPGFDARGRLVYCSRLAPGTWTPPPEMAAVVGNSMTVARDSAMIVRFDLPARTFDTVGTFKIPILELKRTLLPPNGIRMETILNPLPMADDWAVLPDGSIAVVRGRDYHVDWMSAEGKWTSSPRLPFDWQHLSDDEKVVFLDSVKKANAGRLDSAMMATLQASYGVAPSLGAAIGGAVGGGSPVASGGGGRGVGAPSAPGAPGAGASAGPRPPPVQTYIQPSELPDYKPPFFAGATRPDADGNLWIRTTVITQGRPIYDVVNRKGELIDRVQLPPFRIISGFGPGVVYMGVRDSAGVVHLERARVR